MSRNPQLRKLGYGGNVILSGGPGAKGAQGGKIIFKLPSGEELIVIDDAGNFTVRGITAATDLALYWAMRAFFIGGETYQPEQEPAGRGQLN